MMGGLIRRRNERERGGELARPYGGGAWDPFRAMGELLRWDPFGDYGGASLTPGAGFVPTFDVRETKDAYLFTADMPGLREEDIDISLTNNMLTVSGHRESEQTQDSEQCYCAERSFGEFRRSFTLPEGADPEGVEANLKNGVLHMSVKKRPEVQPRRISLGSAGKEKGTGAKA
jgi:HSP20 family protein